MGEALVFDNGTAQIINFSPDSLLAPAEMPEEEISVLLELRLSGELAQNEDSRKQVFERAYLTDASGTACWQAGAELVKRDGDEIVYTLLFGIPSQTDCGALFFCCVGGCSTLKSNSTPQ